MTLGFIAPNNYFAPWDFVKSVLSLPPKYRFIAYQSHSVPDNRNRVWDRVKTIGDDLLFIDTDMTFTANDVAKMEQHLETYDIMTGTYLLADKKYALFQRGERDYGFIEPKKEIFEVGACGAGFLGISKRIMEKMPSNPFSNYWEGAILHGEDVSFCHRAREQGFKIHCDPSIILGHIRTTVIRP